VLVLLSVEVDALLFSLSAIAEFFSEATDSLFSALSDRLLKVSSDFSALVASLFFKESAILSAMRLLSDILSS